MGIGPFQSFQPFNRYTPFQLNPKPVPVVPAVPPLRSVPMVRQAHHERFINVSRTDSEGELLRFGNSRNVEMAAMVNLFRSVSSFAREESDFSLLGLRRRHMLPNRIEDCLYLLVVGHRFSQRQ
jgi:hypothetical protein